MFKRRLPQLLNQLKKDEHVSYWKEIAPLEAKTVPFPAELDFNICQALRKRGLANCIHIKHRPFKRH